MKRWLGLLLLLVLAAPANGMVVLNYAAGQKVVIPITAVSGVGAQGPLGVSHGNVKAQCPVSNSGSEVTINEGGAGFAFEWQSSGWARITFDPTLQSIGSTLGEVCDIWWEGSGAGAGSFATNKTAVQFVPIVIAGAAVSAVVSAEATGSLTLSGTPDPIATDDTLNGWAVQLYGATTKDPKPGGYAVIRDSTAATNVILTWTDISAISAVGDYVGLVPVDSLTGVLSTQAVVSSGDCANSATTFDTTLGTLFSATNGPAQAGIRFISGSLVNEIRRATSYNINGCITFSTGFSGTPAAGDAFVVVNQ